MQQHKYSLGVLLCCLLLPWSCGNTAVGKVDQSTEATALAAAPPAPVQPGETKDELLLGKFDPTRQDGFAAVTGPYTDRKGMYLRTETYEAFKKMYAAAKKDGVVLKIISSTRTFSQQKDIWEGKWARFAKDAPEPKQRALKILEYSAMPGASRHHWGTDMDLNDLNNPAFEKGGKYAKVYEWLVQHAHEYGFCQPYTAKGPERPNGYNEERWHWSYMPLAKGYLQEYSEKITDAMLTGFKGSETAAEIKAVEYYAKGINKACTQ